MWLRVYTDNGLVGLGETYPRNEAEAAAIHTGAARTPLGRDPRDRRRRPGFTEPPRQVAERARKLRDTFGMDIEIPMEFHSNWNLPSAIRIAQAMEPYKPMWLADMLLRATSLSTANSPMPPICRCA